MRQFKGFFKSLAGCVLLLLGHFALAADQSSPQQLSRHRPSPAQSSQHQSAQHQASKHKKSGKLVHITIAGVKGRAAANANNRLKVLIQPITQTTDRQKVEFFYRQAPAQIKSSLEPFGYFEAKVSARLNYHNRHWYMHFIVVPGPRVRIKRVDLQIDGPVEHLKPFQRLRKHFPIHVGAPLNVALYDKAKQRFLDVANSLGFLQAKIVKSRLRIHLATHSAVVILHFSTGKRYRFGHTHFNPSPLKVSFLRKYMTYRAGDFYSSHKVMNFQSGLTNSPYFNQVIVDPDPNSHPPPFVVPVKVHTTAANSQHYTIGGGFGTDTGPRAVASAQWFRVTRTGQQLNLSTSVSARNNFVLANYIIPGSKPAINYYTLTAGASELYLDAMGHARTGKLGVSYNTKILGWNQDVALTYLVENYRIAQLPRASTHMVIPSISWTRRKIHGRSIPKRGYLINLTFAGARKDVLSQASFFQSTLELKQLFTLPTKTRFIIGGQIGRTDIHQLSELPLSLQLLTGGASTLRGYPYKSIGPGRNLILGTVELQQKIYGQFYLAGFYDVGNVSNEFFGRLKQSAGPGLVFLTPLGAFELTIAKPLADPGSKWRVQFSMGATI